MQALPHGFGLLGLGADSHSGLEHFDHVHIGSYKSVGHSHDAAVTSQLDASHVSESIPSKAIPSAARDFRIAGNSERSHQDRVDIGFGTLRVSGATPQLALDRGHDHDRDAVYLPATGTAPLASGTVADHPSRIVTFALSLDLLVAPSEQPKRPGHSRIASPPNPGLAAVPIYLQVHTLLI